MHIEEAEDLRLRESEGVPDGARLQRRVFGQLDDELHAQSPLAARVALGQAEFLVKGLAHRAHRAVAHDGQLRAHVHSGHEAVGGSAGLVHALVGEAQTFDSVAVKERLADRSARPDLHQAAGHQLRANPLVELADGEHQSAVLVKEGGCPGQFEGRVFDAEKRACGFQQCVSKTQKRGAPAGADGVEQIEDALLLHIDGHGNLGRVQVREAGADALGAGHHAADAGGNIVSALVAEHLQRHSRHGFALEGRIGGVFAQRPGKVGEKAAHGRAKAGAGDVHFHRLAVDDLFCLFFHAHAEASGEFLDGVLDAPLRSATFRCTADPGFRFAFKTKNSVILSEAQRSRRTCGCFSATSFNATFSD